MDEINPETNSPALKQSLMLTTMQNQHQKPRSFKITKKPYSLENIRMSKPVPQWNKSATTLRHSTLSFSFSKDQRFKAPNINYYDHHKLQYPSSLSLRAASFGFGNKTKIPEQFSNNLGTATKNCPFYQTRQRVNSSISLHSGKTFGLGWKHFEKTRAPHRSTVHSSDQVRASPGPQHYDAVNSAKYLSGRGKMHERLIMYTDMDSLARKTYPGPQYYQICEKLAKRESRSSAMGYGKKSDFTKEKRGYPGAIYHISGFTDKFIETKRKNMGQRR